VKVSETRETLRQVWNLFRAGASPFVKRRLASVLVLVLAAAVLVPLGPVALKLLVDRFTGDASSMGISVGALIALYIVTQWLSRTIGEIRGLVYARAERRMFRGVSERFFSHVMRLPLRFHLERQTGAVNQTLEQGIQGYQMIMHQLVFTVLPVSAQLGTIVYILVHYRQPVFLAIFCAALVCYAVAFSLFAIRVSNSAESASQAHIDAMGIIADSLLNLEPIKCLAIESVVQARVGTALANTEDQWVGFYKRYARNGLGVAAIYALFLGLAITYATREVIAGRMTVGDFVLVNSYMLQAMQPVEMLGYAVQAFSQGTAMLAKLMELFREKTENYQDDEGGKSVGHLPLAGVARLGTGDSNREMTDRGSGAARPAQIDFDDVSVAYRSDRVILRGVSFALSPGKTLAIVGESGSGKSTIVRLLVRLLDASGGQILIDDTPIEHVPLAALRQMIGVVLQDTVLFNDTIGYNIAVGRWGSSQAEIEEAAKHAHLHEFIMTLPEQYETRVGERGVKLSGGEKQRISIARAALKRPRVYVFDEATSSLDSHTERDILRNLREISRFSTTLMIAHRLSTVVHADEIVVLDQGIIVERGRHAALLNQDGRYARLWEAQLKGSAAA
jgi:ABC-type transport system involved in Fe-S cluster assembly fused permease/ATPase subunit